MIAERHAALHNPRNAYTDQPFIQIMLRAVSILTCAVLLLVASPRVLAQELRGFWVDGFSEGIKSPEQIDTLLARLRRANCNAVFAQVRKSGDAYYLSHYEPWASDDRHHFDSLAYLIDKAHHSTPRIQVHAWMNTCAVGKSRGNSFHITELHPEWLSLSDTGKNHDGEAAKIDPGNPDAADWTFRVYLDVARHYDLDGIHFDFVRYGGTDGKGRWGYNPISVARFNTRYGRTGQPAWDDPLWKQWRREQVTALVRKVYATATTIKPKLIVSAATITWGDGPHDGKDPATGKKYNRESFWLKKSAPMNRVFQDWRSWMKEGILDLNCQMSYYDEKKHPDFFRHWIDWGKDNQFRRFEAAACGAWLNPIASSLQQIDAIRLATKKRNRSRGVMLYSYNGTNSGPDGKEQQSEEFFGALSQPGRYCKNPPFAKWVEAPKFPWKEHPKTGIIKGYVLTADALNPVDGAKVTIVGKVRRSQYTDGTGFYAFVDLPDVDYKVKVEAQGFAPQTKEFAPGRSSDARSDFFLGSPFKSDYMIPAPNHIQMGAPAVYDTLRVIAGTDVFPEAMIVGDMDYVGLARVRLAARPILPFQAGDRIAVKGTWSSIDGQATIDNAYARFMDVFDTEDPAPATVVREISAGELASDGTGLENRVRLKGSVSAVKADRFVLNDAFPVDVMIAGRKEPGVESPVTPLPAPHIGDYVQVTGTVTVTKHSDGTTLILMRPWTAGDIKQIPGRKSVWAAISVVGIGVLIAGGLAIRVRLIMRLRTGGGKKMASQTKNRAISRNSRSD